MSHRILFALICALPFAGCGAYAQDTDVLNPVEDSVLSVPTDNVTQSPAGHIADRMDGQPARNQTVSPGGRSRCDLVVERGSLREHAVVSVLPHRLRLRLNINLSATQQSLLRC